MKDEAFEKYQSVWTAVHNLVDKMLSGEAGAEDIRDKLTNEFRFWKRSGHDISATPPQPEQEPVALEEYDAGLLNDFGGGNVEWWWDYIRAELGRAYEHYQSQITTPPQRTWVGLTDEEREEIENRPFSQNDWLWFYTRDIGAKLKEKNT